MSANNNYRIWMVRAGSGSYLIEEFIEKDIVAVGWNDLGKLDKNIDYPTHRIFFAEIYTEDSIGRANQNASQVWRFVHEFNLGDKVVTYDSNSRKYYLGEIVSDYDFSTDYEYHHYRKVKWMDLPTNRDALTTDAKNKLGSILTIFEINRNIWDELISHNPINSTTIEIEKTEEIEKKEEIQGLEALKEDIIFQSKEFTKDIIVKLTWQDTELLVAGLLRAIGYKTKMTPRGSDLGSDIIASPDELGLEEPRIKVEVKTRSKDKIDAPTLRAFIGGLRDYSKGIFVSTTGFTKEAKYESERANFAITLIELDWLVDLIIDNYEKLDIETKSLIPLRRIYWPI